LLEGCDDLGGDAQEVKDVHVIRIDNLVFNIAPNDMVILEWMFTEGTSASQTRKRHASMKEAERIRR
jgi:hypothetical protein